MGNIVLSIIPDHKVGKLIVNDIHQIAKISFQHKGKGKIDLSSKQFYVSQLMYPCFEIENKFADFDQIYHLLSKYPPGKKFRARHTREQYIIFMLEVYLISQVELFDRILHLVNYVFELGLSDTHVKYEIIVNNTRVNASSKTILKRFDSHLHLSGVRPLQNKIKHKERLRDSNLDTVSLMEMSLRTGRLAESDQTMMKKSVMARYKEYISERKSKMTDETETLKKITIDILDCLYPFIEKKYHSYR